MAYDYFAKYSGQRVAPLPQGYMDAATAPGRYLANGMAQLGAGIKSAVQEYQTAKQQRSMAEGEAEGYALADPERWMQILGEKDFEKWKNHKLKTDDLLKFNHAYKSSVAGEVQAMQLDQARQMNNIAGAISSYQSPMQDVQIPIAGGTREMSAQDANAALSSYYENGGAPVGLSNEDQQRLVDYNRQMVNYAQQQLPQAQQAAQQQVDAQRQTASDMALGELAMWDAQGALQSGRRRSTNMFPTSGPVMPQVESLVQPQPPAPMPTAPTLTQQMPDTTMTMQVPVQNDREAFLQHLIKNNITSAPAIQSAMGMRDSMRGREIEDFGNFSIISEGGKIANVVQNTGQKLTPLQAGEIEKLTSINQARNDIATLKTKMAELGPMGPIVSFFREMNPWDKSSREWNAAINAALPNIARGVFGEVGVLTDTDIERYRQTLPQLKNPKDMAAVLISDMETRLDNMESVTKDALRRSGRDISGWSNAPVSQQQDPNNRVVTMAELRNLK